MTEFLTALLVIITGFYAWATFKILRANEGVLKEMRDQRDALYRQYISISPVMYSGVPCIFLKIKNTGKTAAHNLSLTVDKDFYKYGEKKKENNLRLYSAFTQAIDSFVPEKEMLFYLAQGFKIFGRESDQEITPQVFSVYAEYEYQKKRVVEKTTVDLRPFLMSALPQNAVADNLKQLVELIEKRFKESETS